LRIHLEDPMKVFISWSGPRSEALAEVLRLWLNDVIQVLDPWISSQDIDKGRRWDAEIASELGQSNVGIICLTRENITSPWILFEAGALAKSLDKSLVCPYLLDLKPTELTGPLAQFQVTVANEEDTCKLLRTINKALGENARSAEQLDKAFTKWWPELKTAIDAIPKTSSPAKQLRSDRDLLEEMLSLIRSQVNTTQERKVVSSFFPIGAKMLSDMTRGDDVEAFAGTINLEGGSSDSNAEVWFETLPEHTEDSLDGVWASRWNGGSGAHWKVGTALVKAVGRYVYILHYEGAYAYLLATRREGRTKLVGRYINLLYPEDSTPWVGLIVNNERIDGQWGYGRWDLRRSPSVST